jgi:phosphatidate cytidylyltransferase
MNQNLKLRIITALVGAPVILFLLIWAGVTGVAIFAGIISTGMLFEFCAMYLKQEDAKLKTALLLGTNLLIHVLNYWFAVGINSTFLGIAPVFFFFIVFLLLVPRLLNYQGVAALNTPAGVSKLKEHMNELGMVCLGWVYLGWFPLLMVGIRQAPMGREWLILALIVVWANDILAYFAGKYFGKKLFFETVSPKKTWEGFFGGLAGGLAFAAVYAYCYLPDETPFVLIGISLALGIAAALGDLCESLVKRATDTKDSGTILPGHGGFMDRFDGVLFAMPVMAAFLWCHFR